MSALLDWNLLDAGFTNFYDGYLQPDRPHLVSQAESLIRLPLL
jgi:hypothetical protein